MPKTFQRNNKNNRVKDVAKNQIANFNKLEKKLGTKGIKNYGFNYNEILSDSSL